MTKFFKVLEMFLVLLLGIGLYAASDRDDREKGKKPQPPNAYDPGPRGGSAGAGAPFLDLTDSESAFFETGLDQFSEADGTDEGLGTRFNLDSCGGCHLQPAVGGSSPAVNPQVAIATDRGARNRVPSFITFNGPVREARFPFNADGTPDGGVHALYVITGRDDAVGCNARQENFERQVGNGNVIFRIPTPVFGAGLIEMIPDGTIRDNIAANARHGYGMGIHGHVNMISGDANHNGNDGTIARFGWKAQNKSLLLFSGEAYNVEMGITNEIFQTERDENPTCQFTTLPNTVTDTEGVDGRHTISPIEQFAFFMPFLAPPEPVLEFGSATKTSIAKGRMLFNSTGCALCHTPTLRTGNAAVAALRNKNANLFSDLAVHGMGPGLADGVGQGQAEGDEFRTAPLWGLGQRIFFLHDGRTHNLIEAIRAHKSAGHAYFGPSEANGVIDNFNGLSESQKQDLLNFLRSL